MAISALHFTKRCLQSSSFLRLINPGKIVCVHEYSKWAHRSHVKIVNEEEIFGEPKEEPVTQQLVKQRKSFHRRPRERKVKEKKQIIQPVDPDATLNEDGSPVFTKVRDNDPKLHTLMLAVRSRKERNKKNQILLEGHRLIVDAIEAGAVPQIMIFSRVADVQKLPLPARGVKLYKVPYSTIQLWSDLTTTPGIIGIFETPAVEEKEPAGDALPLTIICDNVREPGNLGAILRAAAGVGCERVILTKGCVDLWDPKVLRSASGAHFRVPIFKSQTWSDVQSLISESANVFLADNNSDSNADSNAAISSTDFGSDSETSGSDSETSGSDSETSGSDSDTSDSDAEKSAENVAEQAENIAEQAENIAEHVRSEAEESNAQKTEKAIADAAVSDGSNAQETEKPSGDPVIAATGALEAAPSPKVKQVIPPHPGIALPVVPYYEVDYTLNEIVIIIGGETQGLSNASFSWAKSRDGVRVNVPLTNGVNSLNTGTAMCVIAFEVKRQFLMRQKNM